jgi:hypothetical protein
MCHGSASAHSRAGEVGDAADRGVVEASLEADPAEGRVPLGDAGGEGEVVAAAGPAGGEILHPRTHGHGHPDRPDCRIGSGQRIVEEHHHPVTGEAFQGALEAEDQITQRRRGTG